MFLRPPDGTRSDENFLVVALSIDEAVSISTIMLARFQSHRSAPVVLEMFRTAAAVFEDVKTWTRGNTTKMRLQQTGTL
jgi:hypothetical protein